MCNCNINVSLHNTFGQSVTTAKLQQKQKPDLYPGMQFKQNCAHYDQLNVRKR